jgi:hypothetical protein
VCVVVPSPLSGRGLSTLQRGWNGDGLCVCVQCWCECDESGIAFAVQNVFTPSNEQIERPSFLPLPLTCTHHLSHLPVLPGLTRPCCLTTLHCLLSSAPPPPPHTHSHTPLSPCHDHHQVGGAGSTLQVLLGIIAFNCLVLKRYWESPRRTWKIWFYDSSKQGTAAVVVHIMNLILSNYMMKQSDHPGDECTWYFTNVILDCTIGLFLVYLMLP